MKILLLGATGRTGKYILEEALQLGYEVNILVRDRSKINLKFEKLKVFVGEPTNINDLKNAIIDCESVLSALNISRTSDFPWAKLRTPKHFLEQTIQNIIQISNTQKIKKVIVISAWGVAETKKDIPFWFRWLIDHSNIKYAYLGHEQSEELLQKSNLNWTSFRPVGLTNSDILKPIITTINNFPLPKLTISRKSVAQFMIHVLANKLFDNQAVTISA